MAASSRAAFLAQALNHVVLPRDVPGGEDVNLHEIELELADRLRDAVKTIIPALPVEHQHNVDTVRLMLASSKSINIERRVDKALLVKELKWLEEGSSLILFVAEQNAALLIYRHASRETGQHLVVFEVFETSAPSERVLAGRSALQWDFPGQAVSVPYDILAKVDFLDSLACFLEQASIETIHQFAAVTYKAGATLPEIRDTTDPALMTGLLMSILEANGGVYRTPLLRKRVRDTVSFHKARKPWRRSPFYLAVRVAIQRHLYRVCGAETGRLLYKTVLCIFLTCLLDDALDVVPHESVHLLKVKLGRRLAKLEADQQNCANDAKVIHECLYKSLDVMFEKSLSSAGNYLNAQWEAYKRRTRRPIRLLPSYASPSDLHLRLRNSGSILDDILTKKLVSPPSHGRSPAELLRNYANSTGKARPFNDIAQRYLALRKYEEDREKLYTTLKGLSLDREMSCISLAEAIKSYISTIGDAFDDYLDLMSGMLLNIMELWVAMDEHATICYPLLLEYNPAFDPKMLCTLHARSLEDMKRVQVVQSYVARRCNSPGPNTIFDDPKDDSFAVRYYDDSDDTQPYKRIRRELDEAIAKARSDKEAECERSNLQHEELIEEIASLTCTYRSYINEYGKFVEEHLHCHKHHLMWVANHMKIQIFEYPLPKPDFLAKAAIFELSCPRGFAAYRDATWMILSAFAYPKEHSIENVPLLCSYTGLAHYGEHIKTDVTLGSTTKPHTRTHYRIMTFPVTFKEVCRPFGMKLKYFDSARKTWISRSTTPSFAMHFSLKLPPKSPYRSLSLSYDNWPTSNRILASQTKCSADLNVHEFMSWQGLLIGTHSRWFSLLRERGSTSINFSTDSTWSLLSRLIHEMGPASNEDSYRDIHAVFRDANFCLRLMEQVAYRLETIRRNWREPVQMDLLISILLKTISLACTADVLAESSRLLREAHSITWAWQTSLLESDDSAEPGKSQIFLLWAAVLCKRTYSKGPGLGYVVGSETLRYFIGASIALERSLVGSFGSLPYNLRNAILQDLLRTYDIRRDLQDALYTTPMSLMDTLNDRWPIPEQLLRSSTDLSFDATNRWCLVTLGPTEDFVKLHVHYHIVLGTLLIEGEQLGTLPPEFRQWSIIEALFGTRNLRTLPSSLPGMSLVIDKIMPYGHQVHLGFRGDNLVIRAVQNERILELISSRSFGSGEHCDLPSSLMMDCYHWLNLRTGIIEIRQDNKWKSKPGNWSLNVYKRRAMRRKSSLVEPSSAIYQAVTNNFFFFEKSHFITVFQPQKGRLSVEMKRLELSFEVRNSGLLLCRQLGVEVVESSSQDPGTWYGLRSKIVVRSIKDPSQLSMLVPLGSLNYEKHEQYVKVVIQNEGAYCKFGINHVLGRVDCAAEPRLLFLRAMFHAYTSHFLPDQLTGRTGVEEALYYLQSCAYQPWSPLSGRIIAECLIPIANLSPERVYYPPDLKCMETVKWKMGLTKTIQDDRFRSAIEKICQRSHELGMFGNVGPPYLLQLPSEDIHLRLRAVSRTYTRTTIEDSFYEARDRRDVTERRSNVAIISKLLADWSARMPNTTDFVQLLGDFQVVGGYDRTFDKLRITDLLCLDLGLEWGALTQTIIKCSSTDRSQLMFLLSTLVFRCNADMELIRVLVAYAISTDLKTLAHPKASAYVNFKGDERPTSSQLAELMKSAHTPFVPADALQAGVKGQLALRRLAHEKEALHACEALAKSIASQWPSEILQVEIFAAVDESLVDVPMALQLVLPEWLRMTENRKYYEYLQHVQLILDRHSPSDVAASSVQPKKAEVLDREQQSNCNGNHYPVRDRGHEIPSLKDLLQKSFSLEHPAPKLAGTRELEIKPNPYAVLAEIPNGITRQPHGHFHKIPKIADGSASKYMPKHIHELRALAAKYRHSPSAVRQRYGSELEHSITTLLVRMSSPQAMESPFDPTQLSTMVREAAVSLSNHLIRIRHAVQRGDGRAKWLQHAGLWPRLTLITLLSQLRSTSAVCFGENSKEMLVRLGLLVTEYQRLLRIQGFSRTKRHQQLREEQANLGHQNWSPFEHSDWLLIEIDGNIMIRPEQVEVAQATISPESGHNSLLQLLMGKGKTSCILPMVATVLANLRQLFRIVLPRPLLLQCAQIMQTKLGGLLDRETMHIPFSRATSTGGEHMKTYFRLINEIRKNGGIMLALPEHILSFKLSGVQQLCNNMHEDARMMIKVQAWLDKHSRDVLDECDVSLAIRTQLIYPSGSLMTVDGHPLRWQTIQAVLRLVHLSLGDLQSTLPQSIEVVKRPLDSYPFIYFLRKDVEDRLLSQLVEVISRGRTAIVPGADLGESDHQAIKLFISSSTISPQVLKHINEAFKGRTHLLKVIYLLRGLFVHRILLSTLKKRWNVQYGLHPGRDPIAVPYLAKGVPSPSAEWGHPDVSIILTCLSFYYQGLDVAQFKQAFEQLLKVDEPSIEYEKWAIRDLPEAFRDYTAINVEDSSQLCDIHRYVRYNVHLLDFYMNIFVFPIHAKQFATKLQASGWDLVQYAPGPKQAACRTTGFSGTNDSRHQLPLTIKQNDLPKLSHTNAEVLGYLLEERNRRYVLLVDDDKKRLSEEALLHWLSSSTTTFGGSNRRERIRVLIDAGAQILEHDNRSLAKLWLEIDHEADAAVYFDDTHRALVTYKKGKVDVPLVASPFAEDMEGCLVYLDESHCRGTDLKLPVNARAALTLGPHLTKDALVQAAMRLRQLGQSQSVTFFSPPEVHQSILDLREGNQWLPLTSYDVIRWVLEQTCNGIDQLEPLYYNQGMNYIQRTQANMDNKDFLEDDSSLIRYLSVVRTVELQTLKQMYEPRNLRKNTVELKITSFDSSLQGFVSDLLQRKRDFQDGGVAIHSSALEEVEQEREVEFEVESVREVQEPINFRPLVVSTLHKDIITFVKIGRLPAASDAYQPMFYALQKTALGLKHGSIALATLPSRLFVSTQFGRTVKLTEPNDNFLRPCQWLLWSQSTESGLIVSPEEADRLIPILREQNRWGPASAGVHLVIYSAPVTRRMLHFNNLDFYALPSFPKDFQVPLWLKVELGIFSGRLYFGWDEYPMLRAYLGPTESAACDGETQLSSHLAFAKKPLTFLHEWLAVRRKGQDFEHTPMGFITTGKPLSAEHPFFIAREATIVDADSSQEPVPFSARRDEEDESEDGDDHDEDVFYDAADAEYVNVGDHLDYYDADNAFFDGEEYAEKTAGREDEEE